MKNIMTIVGGMGVLIGIYLFINRATDTAAIIKAIGGQTTSAVKTLQGR
jgi:hypothetical protein